MSHVIGVICQSNFGLFLAASSIQLDMNLCDRSAQVRLPIAEDLMNEIAVITGKLYTRHIHIQLLNITRNT